MEKKQQQKKKNAYIQLRLCEKQPHLKETSRRTLVYIYKKTHKCDAQTHESVGWSLM